MSSSGDPKLDHALIAELREIVKIFPVNPGFKYVEDDSPNAYASEDTIVPGTKGTVYIGLNLLRSQINANPRGGIAAAGICAHECAHIYQFFSSDLSDRLEDKDNGSGVMFELHADLLAGYYLKRKGWSFDRIRAFAESLFGIGDYLFNDPDHHGTPSQRVSAMREGFDCAMQQKSLEEVATSCIPFIKGLIGRRPLKAE